MSLTEYSIAEGGLVEDLRRADSDEYLSNFSEERLPSEPLWRQGMEAESMYRLLVSKMENQCLVFLELFWMLFCMQNCSFLHLCFSSYGKSGQTANQIPSLIESKPLQMYILRTLSISAVLPLLVPHHRSLPNYIMTCRSQSRTFVI